MNEISISSERRTEMIDITDAVQQAVDASGVRDGLCIIYVPHTTAAVTINEGADPAVKSDIVMELDKIAPQDDGYAHVEGNSAGHIKSSIVGVSEAVFISDGKLVLGTWQSVYFCEFDGPRRRRAFVKVLTG